MKDLMWFDVSIDLGEGRLATVRIHTEEEFLGEALSHCGEILTEIISSDEFETGGVYDCWYAPDEETGKPVN